MQDFGWKHWEKENIWKTYTQWEDKIKMNIKEKGYGGLDLSGIDRGKWRVCENDDKTSVFKNVRNFLISCVTIPFTKTVIHGISQQLRLDSVGWACG